MVFMNTLEWGKNQLLANKGNITYTALHKLIQKRLIENTSYGELTS